MANEFQNRIEDPYAWFIFADISLRGAGVLWQVSDEARKVFADVFAGDHKLEDAGNAGSALQMSIPSLLLAGFGIESLLKAIRLKQMHYRGEPMTATKEGVTVLVGSLKTHNLKSLAQQASI